MKRTPDTEAKMVVKPDYDVYTVDQAIQLKEKFKGEAIVLSSPY